MTRYFLGVDAGASKTHALVMTEEGSLLGWGESGTGNHETYGFDHARNSIGTALRMAADASGIDPSQGDYACFCLAGADVSQDYETIPQRILDPLLGNVPYSLKNDAFGCLRGGTRSPYGIMINCGTGQVAVGRDRAGKAIRIGGYGFEFGDYSGGSVIAQAAVAAVVRADDGRGEATQLTEWLLEAANLDTVSALIDRTYRDDAYLASLGVPALTFRASAAGDQVARRIILAAAEEMAVTATALVRRLEMEQEEFDLITAGSVFRGEDPVFLETVIQSIRPIAPRANHCFPLYAPVVGAVLLASEEAGLTVSDSMYSNLEATMPEEL